MILEGEKQLSKFSANDKAVLRLAKRRYDKNSKLDSKFVSKFSELTSKSLNSWIEARKKSDFKIFEPCLKELISMLKEKSERVGYKKHPYDVLLDDFEESVTTNEVEVLLTGLRNELVPLSKSIQQKQSNWKLENIKFDLQKNRQVNYADHILQSIGYDFARGRQDESVHPFTSRISYNDRRVTNRYSPDSLEFIFTALHEGGHALYEQGVSKDIADSFLDTDLSLMIHESQSRFYENIVGKSKSYWESEFTQLQKFFEPMLNSLDIDTFLKYIRKICPTQIRVESDEVTYDLHIIIRFEIEKSLIEGSLKTSEVPELWNQKYKDYLGIEIKKDSLGCLQDVHWSLGAFGYFPTYSLGNIAASQIWNRYIQQNPDFTFSSKNLNLIKTWLNQNIHMNGAIYPGKKLIKKLTGQDLNHDYYLDRLKQRYLQSKD